MTEKNPQSITISVPRRQETSINLAPDVSAANTEMITRETLLETAMHGLGPISPENDQKLAELIASLPQRARAMQDEDDAVCARFPDLPTVEVIYHAQRWWPQTNSDQAIEISEHSVVVPPRLVIEHIEALVGNDSADLDHLVDDMGLRALHPDDSGPDYLHTKDYDTLDDWLQTHHNELPEH